MIAATGRETGVVACARIFGRPKGAAVACLWSESTERQNEEARRGAREGGKRGVGPTSAGQPGASFSLDLRRLEWA